MISEKEQCQSFFKKQIYFCLILSKFSVQIVEDKTMSLIGDVVKIQDKILLSGSSLSLWKQLESEPTVMRIGNCSLDGTGTNTSYSGTFINSHSFMVTDRYRFSSVKFIFAKNNSFLFTVVVTWEF